MDAAYPGAAASTANNNSNFSSCDSRGPHTTTVVPTYSATSGDDVVSSSSDLDACRRNEMLDNAEAGTSDDNPATETIDALENETKSTERNSVDCEEGFTAPPPVCPNVEMKQDEQVADQMVSSTNNTDDAIASRESHPRSALDLTKSRDDTTTLLSSPESSDQQLSYRCGACDAHFFQKSQLDRHALIHSTTSHVCGICQKTFANVYRLQRHMISHQETSEMRKFRCLECRKAFKFKHHLKEHSRIHSGEKPFQCHNCDKRFSHSGSYSSHTTSKKCYGVGRGVEKSSVDMPASKPSTSIGLMSLKMTPSSVTQSLISFSLTRATSYVVRPASNVVGAGQSQTPLICAVPSFTISSLDHLKKLGVFIKRESGGVDGGSEERLDENQNSKSTNFVEKITTDNDDDGSFRNNLESVLEASEGLAERKPSGADVKAELAEEESRSFGCVSPMKDDDFTGRSLIALAVVAEKLREEMRVEEARKESSDTEINKCDVDEDIAKEHVKNVKQRRSVDDLEEAKDVKSESNNDDDDNNIAVAIFPHHRIRSLITGEHRQTLKELYEKNARPSKADFERLAEKMPFSKRIVQVWFQNMRARDRRRARIDASKSFLAGKASATAAVEEDVVPSGPFLGLLQQPAIAPCFEEPMQFEPLDLSKKAATGIEESAGNDAFEEALNLCTKPSPPPPLQDDEKSTKESNMTVSIGSRSDDMTAFFLPSTSSVAPEKKLDQESLVESPPIAQFVVGTSSIKEFSMEEEEEEEENFYCVAAIADDGIVRTQTTSISLECHDDNGKIGGGDSRQSESLNKEISSDAGANDSQDGGEREFDESELVRRKRVRRSWKQHRVSPDHQLYACDQCDKMFGKQSSLARHKYEHSGQRPFACNDCEKAFKHKHHLTEHQRLHSGEKPFQCQQCNKSFSHSGSFSQHMKNQFKYCKPDVAAIPICSVNSETSTESNGV